MKETGGRGPLFVGLVIILLFFPVARAASSPFYQLRNVEESQTDREDTSADEAAEAEVEPTVDTFPEDEASISEGETSPGVEEDTAPDDEVDEETPAEPAPAEEEAKQPAREDSAGEPVAEDREDTDEEEIVSPAEDRGGPPAGEEEKEEETDRGVVAEPEEEDQPEEKNDEELMATEGPPLTAPVVEKYFPTARAITSSPPEGAILSEDRSDTPRHSPLAAGELSGPAPAEGSYFSWEYMAGAGLFLLLFLLIWWKRRPRKVKVYYDSTTAQANKYFQEHFTRHSALGRKQKKSSSTSKSLQDKSSSPRKGRPIWEYEDEKLEELGIDPKYREALRLYYSRGLPLERIARETGYGSGEIGLVIDLTRRLREEAV